MVSFSTHPHATPSVVKLDLLNVHGEQVLNTVDAKCRKQCSQIRSESHCNADSRCLFIRSKADIGSSLLESNAQGPCTEMATERLCLNQCRQSKDANDYVMKHAGNKDMYNRSETGDLKLYIQQSPSVERPMQGSAELNPHV